MERAAVAPERAHPRAAKIWRNRHRFELLAAARFASLAEHLAERGASSVIVELARSAVEDEKRHARLCAELAAHFSASPSEASHGLGPIEVPLPRAPRLGPKATPRVALLYELVAMSCITETLSTTLLGELVDQAAPGRPRDVMHEILRDEVSHARIGWAYLAEIPRDGAQSLIAHYLPAMLAGTVTEELFDETEESPEVAALIGLGQLPRTMRRELFEATLEEVVFPGLARFGIDPSAGRHWLARRTQGELRHTA